MGIFRMEYDSLEAYGKTLRYRRNAVAHHFSVCVDSLRPLAQRFPQRNDTNINSNIYL